MPVYILPHRFTAQFFFSTCLWLLLLFVFFFNISFYLALSNPSFEWRLLEFRKEEIIIIKKNISKSKDKLCMRTNELRWAVQRVAELNKKETQCIYQYIFAYTWLENNKCDIWTIPMKYDTCLWVCVWVCRFRVQ